MTITKHGKYFENHRLKCCCGCEWKAGTIEVYFDDVIERDGVIYNPAICECPECGIETLEENWEGEYDE